MTEILMQVIVNSVYFFMFAFVFIFIWAVLDTGDSYGTYDGRDKKFRKSIKDFKPLIDYTERVINGEIPCKFTSNNKEIETDKIVYFKRNAELYLIKKSDDEEVLFWELFYDRYNPFSSAGELSRKIRKLFKEEFKRENLRETRLTDQETNRIKETINQLNLKQ